MATESESLPAELDPAAVLALATSLRNACEHAVASEPRLNLSETYNGYDEFMRELMRVANLFEAWACAHVSFDELGEVWPYLMEDKFGDACLQCVRPDALAAFDQNDCLRVALRLGLPIQSDDQLRVPVDVRATNIIEGSGFREFRIQTVRNEVDGSGVVPFTVDDEPFDADFSPPHFALYGVGDDRLAEHIADRATYSGPLMTLCG